MKSVGPIHAPMAHRIAGWLVRLALFHLLRTDGRQNSSFRQKQTAPDVDNHRQYAAGPNGIIDLMSGSLNYCDEKIFDL